MRALSKYRWFRHALQRYVSFIERETLIFIYFMTDLLVSWHNLEVAIDFSINACFMVNCYIIILWIRGVRHFCRWFLWIYQNNNKWLLYAEFGLFWGVSIHDRSSILSAIFYQFIYYSNIELTWHNKKDNEYIGQIIKCSSRCL